MSKKRPTIGLAICGLEDDYAASVCRGVVSAAEENDCNLIIFPGRYIDIVSDSPVENIAFGHYNTMYSYASEKNLDFLIAPFGAICATFKHDLAQEFISQFSNVPIVSLSIEVEGCSCVRYDCRPGIRDMVRHLVLDHGCRRIAFVSGSDGNPDSEERFAAFKDALAEQNITFDNRLLAHGNFSEFCDDVIEDLLISQHYDIDAIVCANDAMAISAYKALSRCHLVPGKDIIVTGYDNLPMSSSCVPSLSSIAANASETGYRAVLLGLEALRTGQPIASLTLPTSAIMRESCCGLSCFSDSTLSGSTNIVANLDDIVQHWINTTDPEQQIMLTRLVNSHSRRFLSLLFSEITDPNIKQISSQKLVTLFREFSLSGAIDNTSGSSLCDMLSIIQSAAFNKVSDPDKEKQLLSLFVSLYRVAVSAIDSINYRLSNDMRRTLIFTNNISGHISSYSKDTGATMKIIMEYLSRLNVRNSYLYLAETPIPISSPDDIHALDRFCLVACQHGTEHFSFADNPPLIDKYDIFDNEYTSDSGRKTVMISPLYSSREQYGVIVCDLSYQHLSLFQAVISQINSTLESAFLFSKLNRQLDETENENVILSTIATCDALTGCYNRLGLFERAGSAIVSPLNHNRLGFVLFADVNNLKLINDTFSHDDGDRALRLAVESFNECFGRTGIVGRIGGDEFIIVWITDDKSTTCEKVYRKVKNCVKKHDKQSDSPYHVTVSIGVHSFICNEHLSLQSLIDEADRLLYIDKAHKPDSIAKIQDDSHK